MRYRPEIDGLRAVAVLPVILFHAGFGFFSGGFIGVDVFFVISGYLIFSIIIGDVESGRFSIWQFFARRVRRILPTLLVVLVLSSVVSFFLMVPSQLKEFGQSVVASIFFTGNVFFWLKADYWAQSSEVVPLLHLWSLGVEEQFYLAAPLIALIALRKRLLFGGLVALTSISFASMLYMYRVGHEAAAFYLLPFRMWEVSAGAIAALLQQSWGFEDPKSRAWRDAISGGSLLLLLVGVVAINSETGPAIAFGLPVAATFCLVLFCRDGVTSRILAARPFVWIGLLSYALYLFHQPVFVFLRLLRLDYLDAFVAFVGVAITFILAILNYRIVEAPCRSRQKFSGPVLFPALAFCALACVIWGGVLHQSLGLRGVKLSMLGATSRGLIVALEEERMDRSRVWSQSLKGADRPFDGGNDIKTIFIGDSLSEDLFVAAVTSDLAHHQFRRLAIDETCLRAEAGNGIGSMSLTCKRQLDVLRKSSVLRVADRVVIANAWLSNADRVSFLLNDPMMQSKTVLIYKSHAFLDILSASLAADKFAGGVSSPLFKEFVFQNRHQRTMVANRRLQAIADDMGLETLEGFRCFCSDEERACTLFSGDGRPYLIDQAHLSLSGLAAFRGCIVDQMLGPGEIQSPDPQLP